MAKPVFLITLGAVAGAVVGVIDGGGGLGREVADKILDGAAAVTERFQAVSLLEAAPSNGSRIFASG